MIPRRVEDGEDRFGEGTKTTKRQFTWLQTDQKICINLAVDFRKIGVLLRFYGLVCGGFS